jgi:hypothetical protein
MTTPQLIHAKEIHSFVRNNLLKSQFHLPPAIVQEYLTKYYILHWTGKHFLSKVLISPAGHSEYISHQDLNYAVHYMPGLKPWDIVTNPIAQFRLSFRYQSMPDREAGIVLIDWNRN